MSDRDDAPPAATTPFTRDELEYWDGDRPADHGGNGLYREGPQEARLRLWALAGNASELLEVSQSAARSRIGALNAATCDALMAGCAGNLDRACRRAEKLNATRPEGRHLTFQDVRAAHQRFLARQAPAHSPVDGARALLAALSGAPTRRRRQRS